MPGGENIELRLQQSSVRTSSTAGTYVAAGIAGGLPRNLFCDPWVDEAPLPFCVVALPEWTPAGR